MKIRETGSRPGGPMPGRGPEGLVQESEAKPFDSVLKETRYYTVKEELTRLFKEIEDQGRRLSEKATLEDLIKYKKTVSQFLGKAVQGMLEFRKHDYFDRQGRRNVYALIKKVDQKLEELTQEVLDSQAEHLKVIGCIDDIRGLLMDLML